MLTSIYEHNFSLSNIQFSEKTQKHKISSTSLCASCYHNHFDPSSVLTILMSCWTNFRISCFPILSDVAQMSYIAYTIDIFFDITQLFVENDEHQTCFGSKVVHLVVSTICTLPRYFNFEGAAEGKIRISSDIWATKLGIHWNRADTHVNTPSH